MSVNREWLEKDYYAVLGVPKDAGQTQIKKAYRKLAQQFHPDANRGDARAEERFKEVSNAYDVLGDEQKRAEYDRVRQMGAAGFRLGGNGGPGGTRFEDLGFEGADLGDLFGGLFGGRPGRRGTQRGADVETEVRIQFEDAVQGATMPVTVRGAAGCTTCGESGAEPGTSAQTCPQCGGTGSVVMDEGVFSLARGCPRCGGSGRVIDQPCHTCGGSGRTLKTRELKVRIPAGVEDGARIRVAGRGEPGPRGARAGDLYVVVRVSPHKLFARRGANLMLHLPITFTEAALGANVSVPTLDGSVTLKIPAGTASGKTFRLRGRGIQRSRGGRGDLLVTVDVQVPKRLSRAEKELLERFQEQHREDPRAALIEEEVAR